MQYLLDTDTCIYMIRRRAPETLRRLKRYSPGDVGISSITLGELAFGVWRRRADGSEFHLRRIGGTAVRYRTGLGHAIALPNSAPDARHAFA